MLTKKPQTRRKSLRERVADRKAGIPEQKAPKSISGIKTRKWLRWGGNAFQALGILIMLLVVMRFNDGNLEFMEELIGIAAGFFLTGRISILFIKNS
ncbi:hypothetical protein [Emcibacter nanhaiensis]|uniref:Uncharacterized protein n=1 Tax=Emcibacter nanhaiensis TaxID=1505037 RepID=A0A501PCE3_9PROT|nr:hypothetical protein [Emcibacter nanhaiensis]TPD57741.1 hypothetical protein FIV46_16700 [Emcibacter nanhaiensis]